MKQPPVKISIFLEHFFKKSKKRHLKFQYFEGCLDWLHIIGQCIVVEFRVKPEEFF